MAQLLRADLLPEAWIAPPQVRQLRALLRHRASLVRVGTQARNRIHAVVAGFGYDRAGTYWTGPGRGWLAELDLPPVSRQIVTGCLAVIDALEVTIGGLDGQLRARAKAGPRVKTLTALPGVGQFTALVMLAEIGDITRFGSARKLASWAGLTPTVRGSDLPVRHGHIPQTGLGVAAVGPQPGGADRQALPGIHRHLRCDRETAREEDRHHRDLPQAADPRLSPARRRSRQGTSGGGRYQRHRHRRGRTRRRGRVTRPRARSLQRYEPATRPRSII